MSILGIDVGGTGIKGAPVDTKAGKLLAERFRIKTPHPADPQPIAAVVEQIARNFDWNGKIGIGFPAPIKNGVALMAANISQKWVGVNVDDLFTKITGCSCTMINDADAAGLAEITHGAGRGHMGTVILVDLGTGIGSALLYHGRLIPNAQLGHIEIKGKDAETRASDSARQAQQLSWKKYAKRLDRYLKALERLFWPDLFIIGGGGSHYLDKYQSLLTVEVPVVPAQMLNDAGIVGAAMAAEREK
jgi:polyphosphate glucokinase